MAPLSSVLHSTDHRLHCRLCSAPWLKLSRPIVVEGPSTGDLAAPLDTPLQGNYLQSLQIRIVFPLDCAVQMSPQLPTTSSPWGVC